MRQRLTMELADGGEISAPGPAPLEILAEREHAQSLAAGLHATRRRKKVAARPGVATRKRTAARVEVDV